jgi:hypothetical protein
MPAGPGDRTVGGAHPTKTGFVRGVCPADRPGTKGVETHAGFVRGRPRGAPGSFGGRSRGGRPARETNPTPSSGGSAFPAGTIPKRTRSACPEVPGPAPKRSQNEPNAPRGWTRSGELRPVGNNDRRWRGAWVDLPTSHREESPPEYHRVRRHCRGEKRTAGPTDRRGRPARGVASDWCAAGGRGWVPRVRSLSRDPGHPPVLTRPCSVVNPRGMGPRGATTPATRGLYGS